MSAPCLDNCTTLAHVEGCPNLVDLFAKPEAPAELRELVDLVRNWRDAKAAHDGLSYELDESAERGKQRERLHTKQAYAEIRLLEQIEAIDVIEGAKD